MRRAKFLLMWIYSITVTHDLVSMENLSDKVSTLFNVCHAYNLFTYHLPPPTKM